MRTYEVKEADEAQRLDRVVAGLLGCGLREARRRIEEGHVRVNERAARPGLKLRGGMRVKLDEATGSASIPDGVEILQQTPDFAALAKPHGVASAHIAGRDTPSIQAALPMLFPNQDARLLNRLDTPTSGIVLVGFGQQAATRFRAGEDAGEVEKRYVTIVDGEVHGERVLRRALDTADRATTRVLDHDDPDPLRHTRVTGQGSRLNIIILKGARHQIRAHLACVGHPIVGDVRYGGPQAERLHLHHEGVAFPGFAACWPAPF